MRCVDAIGKLSNWAEPCDDPTVADHLTRCPRCAAWAERDARLGRLWDATRPAEPSAEEWDGAWRRISDALDRGEPAVARPLRRSGGGRRAWWIALGVAQAAAVLLAVLYFQADPRDAAPRVVERDRPVAAPPEPSVPVERHDDIQPGGLVIFHIAKGHIETEQLALNGGLNQVDPGFEALNALEAIAQ